MRYLLLIDSSGDVVLADADNDVRLPIGKPLGSEERSRVTSAVWSPAGEWTAWSVDSRHPDGTRELRVHAEETDEWSVLAESVSAFYLSPSPCGRWLSHLSAGPLGLELAVTTILGGETVIAERGQPLFWSWAADSTELAVHVGDRVSLVGPDGKVTRPVSEGAGRFIVPWWLPGGSVLYAEDDRLVSFGPDGTVTSLLPGGSSGRFAPAPDGMRIAVVEVVDGRPRLVVLDLMTGGHHLVAEEPVAGFFWSPDGARLAALVAAGEQRLRWLVFDGSEIRSLAPFRPSPTWAGSVLPFFEQYAQSHHHWSADATMLVAPVVRDDGPAALIQYVDDPDRDRWVPDAELVWWA